MKALTICSCLQIIYIDHFNIGLSLEVSQRHFPKYCWHSSGGNFPRNSLLSVVSIACMHSVSPCHKKWPHLFFPQTIDFSTIMSDDWLLQMCFFCILDLEIFLKGEIRVLFSQFVSLQFPTSTIQWLITNKYDKDYLKTSGQFQEMSQIVYNHIHEAVLSCTWTFIFCTQVLIQQKLTQ